MKYVVMKVLGGLGAREHEGTIAMFFVAHCLWMQNVHMKVTLYEPPTR